MTNDVACSLSRFLIDSVTRTVGRLAPIAPSSARCQPMIDELEDRWVPTFNISAEQQLAIELVNYARIDPVGFANLYGIDLNEGLAAGTISADSKQPLAYNASLTTAAVGHGDAMIAQDFFAHDNPTTGSSPSSRATAAGYDWTLIGENLAVGTSNFSTVYTLFEGLFVDAGIEGRGHRTNMLNEGYREIGTATPVGPLTYQSGTFESLFLVQEFGTRSSNPFLTGVAYDDVDASGSYGVGEGLQGVFITAISSGGQVFSTSTGTSGGYSLELPAGTYTVTIAGAGINTVQEVTIGDLNLKRDFTPQNSVPAPPPAPNPVTTATGIPSIYRDGTAVLDINGNHVYDASVDLTVGFGQPGDNFIVGDWNGNGIDKIGIQRGNLFALDLDGDLAFTSGVDVAFTFGVAGDKAFAGDFNGDGVDELAIFREGNIIIDTNNNFAFDAGIDQTFAYGVAAATPVAGDFDGNGIDQIATMFNGAWAIDVDEDFVFTSGVDVTAAYGTVGDLPIVGDWSTTGFDRIGIFRNGSMDLDIDGNLVYSAEADLGFGFGNIGDLPLVGEFFYYFEQQSTSALSAQQVLSSTASRAAGDAVVGPLESGVGESVSVVGLGGDVIEDREEEQEESSSEATSVDVAEQTAAPTDGSTDEEASWIEVLDAFFGDEFASI
ncbi:Cysteine-rich secretory protein family protein [Planctomycetes bacterium Pan216]|uniref:Cysteine-rich secretory protein family protein n=1 Tax=Kolteria novifilia TaxID=2527975 RepID=A0A518B1W4_9BACT|nr:Cysteine-rich secretory protein family protein [Planctomycetes bacterium Pan216]